MLNELARQFHLRVFLPVLRLFLPARTRLEPRNSVLTPTYFSALWSDVDVAILTDETNEEKLAALHRTLRRIRTCYPWLGEAEIYTPRSWARLVALKHELAPSYEQARMLRKFFWFKEHRRATGLKRLKHDRFLRVLRKKLSPGASLAEVVHATFRGLIEHTDESAGDVSYYHDYFQCVISTTANDDHPIPFLPGEAMALAHSFPLNTGTRQQLGLGDLTPRGRLIVEVEILEVTGAFTGLPKPAWYLPWLETLRSLL
jgi:hypothetical protein